MKFVHLCARRNVSRIRRDGIRLGNGWRGRGVYAVPLAMLPQFAEDDWLWPSKHGDPHLSCERLSTSRLWKHLFRGKLSPRGRDYAVVVFELSAAQWPVVVYAAWPEGAYREFVAEDRASGNRAADRSWSLLPLDRRRRLSPWELAILAPSPRVLGRLLHRFHQCGPVLTASNDDGLEVLIRSPIGAGQVRRIVPCYATWGRRRKRRLSDRLLPAELLPAEFL